MNSIEERLRDAFGAAAQAVRPDSLGELRDPPRVTRARRLAPVAAAAAVAVIVVGASISVPLLLAGGHHSRPSPAGGGAPTPAPSVGASGSLRAVPTVVGMPVHQAAALLQAAGLNVEVAVGAATSVPQGTVIAQIPAGGGELPVGATVTLTINRGRVSSSATFGIVRPVTASVYAVTIAIPAGWQPTPNRGRFVGYRGADGWMELRSAAYAAGLPTACASIAAGNGEPVGINALPTGSYREVSHPYGSHPEIEYWTFDGRPGCLIIPSGDAPTVFRPANGAALPMTSALVEYRSPLTGGANFLVISADPPHLMGIISSVQLHH